VRLEIEVKSSRKKPTEAQQGYIDTINKMGGIAFYVDSIEMLETKLLLKQVVYDSEHN
jgi:hypothetical protein